MIITRLSSHSQTLQPIQLYSDYINCSQLMREHIYAQERGKQHGWQWVQSAADQTNVTAAVWRTVHRFPLQSSHSETCDEIWGPSAPRHSSLWPFSPRVAPSCQTFGKNKDLRQVLWCGSTIQPQRCRFSYRDGERDKKRETMAKDQRWRSKELLKKQWKISSSGRRVISAFGHQNGPKTPSWEFISVSVTLRKNFRHLLDCSDHCVSPNFL